jgi:aryl-alcohol dehydrogenase-like predicted oxidoreductase
MTDLPRASFGTTGARITRLGFGAMELRAPGGSGFDRAAAKSLLHAVLDHGINFIDTSPDYGESETLIGEALGARRDEYFIATKCGCPVDPSRMDRHLHDYSRSNIRRGVEESLRRLRTDYVDLVQIHLSPSREELERSGSLAELEAMRREGKLRFVGMSGVLPDLADHIAMRGFDAFQIPYSALELAHGELITEAANAGAGVIVRGGVYRGLAHARRGALQRARRQIGRILGRGLDRWERAGLDAILGGMSVPEFMLRFTLSHPGQSTTIVGTRSRQHLEENVRAAAKGPLPADLYEEAERRLRAAA